VSIKFVKKEERKQKGGYEYRSEHKPRSTRNTGKKTWTCLFIEIDKVCVFLCFIKPILGNQCTAVVPGFLHFFPFFFESTLALRTPEERLPSGGPKEEFGRMIFLKNISLGNRTKVPWQVLVKVRRGTGRRVTPGVYQTITAAQPHSSLYKGAVQNSP